MVFDKTGTLTHNTLEVTDIRPLAPEIDEERAAAMIASLGEHTSHPIARAVVRLAEQRRLAHIPHEEVNFIVGHGVQANVEGRSIRFGSRHFLEDDEHISFAAARELVNQFRAEGKSLLYVAADDRPLAVVALRDRLRAESAATLARLRALGVKRLVMITATIRRRPKPLERPWGSTRSIMSSSRKTRRASLRRSNSRVARSPMSATALTTAPR